MLLGGKKKLLADLFFRFGILQMGESLRPFDFACLCYHRVRKSDFDPYRDPIYPFCESVFEHSELEFYHHMEWLRKNANPLSETELIDAIKRRKRLPPRSVLVTFDDAYVDNYTIAYPILKTFNIPATFFIPTEFITDRKLGWWDLISYFVKRSKKSSISVRTGQDPLNLTLSSEIKERAAVIRYLQGYIKVFDNDQTSSFIQALGQACEVEKPSYEIQDAELMTWHQIRELSDGLFHIGSHTHSHRILKSLSLFEQRRELSHSKLILEEVLQKPIHSVAFPVGGYEHFHSETQLIAKELGYSIAFSYLTGTNPLRLTNAFDIKRIRPGTTISHFTGTLVWPSFFAKKAGRIEQPSPYHEHSSSRLSPEHPLSPV